MIDGKNKYIFIHIPKCAGTSIEYVLNKRPHREWDNSNKIWVQHATAQQIKKLYCHNYEDYFSFAFVRNPWDRVVSDYFWVRRDLKIKGSLKNYLLLEKGFDTQRLGYPHRHKTGRGDHRLPQSDFILNEKGANMVDFIGRVENAQEDFNKVCEKIGIPQQELPHLNTTRHKHYIEYYNDETREIVAEKYAKDIEYFDYKFGD